MSDFKSFTDFYMFFLNPFIQWNLRRETMRKMRIIPRDRILEKKFEWVSKMRIAEKTGNDKDYIKFRHYLDVLEFILNEKID